MSENQHEGLSPVLDSGMLDDFFSESEEHLKKIRQALVALEPSLNQPAVAAPLLEELFRNYHSFKGIAAIVGLRAAESLSHLCEDYLRDLTKGRVKLTRLALDGLMDAAQKLEEVVSAFRTKSPAPEVESVRDVLRQLCEGGEISGEAPPPAGPLAPTGPVWQFIFVPSQKLDQRGVNLNRVRERLAAVGEIIHSVPEVRGAGQVAFKFAVRLTQAPPDLASWETDGIQTELLSDPKLSPSPPVQESGAAAVPFIAPSHVVRVDLRKLDELMRIAGEMVIQRSRLAEQLNRANRRSGEVDLDGLNESNASLGRSLRDLRQAIMAVRLVPVSEMFSRMPFVVRDLARGTEKQVRLELAGQETELDKYLVERLKDPLLHLVRNAFSHGIELPGERVAAGKPAEAVIRLSASTEGDAVLLQIRDDGRGIDAEAVLKRARAQGIVLPDAARDIVLLTALCSPGFSTRDDADRAAGRGMGMSVVFDTVRELGGRITLDTVLGRGTCFSLRLPLTLAIAETFIVSAADQTFAIPQSYVREVMHIQTSQIQTINRVEMVPYRAGVLPVTRLSSMFHLAAPAREQMSLLVLASERGRAGLVVDRIHGQREVVVRALRDPLVAAPGIMGATELGDGRPVLILDGAVFTSGAVQPHETAAPIDN